jgi:hypothetical protein
MSTDHTLLFLVTTARESPASVDQLVSLLAPHPVVIHHDFTARAEHGFRAAPNLEMSPGPGKAGWGVWALVEAVRDTMRHCLEKHDFDYLQVLSGSCLPIRPIAEFQRFVTESRASVHLDAFDLRNEPGAVVNYASRMLADKGTFGFRALHRLRRLRVGLLPATRPVAGLEVPMAEHARWLSFLDPLLGAAMHWQGRTRAGAPQVDPVLGSNWFGLRREACEFLVQRLYEPEVIAHFRGRYIVEENAMPALLWSSGYELGPSNHLINRFDGHGHPVRLATEDLPSLLAAPRWFARKFPDDANAPVRLAMMRHLRGERLREAETT